MGFVLLELDTEIDAAKIWGTKVPTTEAYKGFQYDHADKITVSASLADSEGKIIVKRYFKPGEYTITYNGNGHDSGGPLKPHKYTYTVGTELKENKTQGEDVAYVKSGYHIELWNTRADGKGDEYAPGEKYGVTQYGDVTMYAQWKINSPEGTVIYISNYPDNVDAERENVRESFTKGSPTVIDNPKAEWKTNAASKDYSFVSWNTRPDGSGDSMKPGDSKTFNQDVVYLYAQWSDEIPPDINLVVNHYKENKDHTYTLFESEKSREEANTFVTPDVRHYSGYKSPDPVTVKINTNGITYVNYNYDLDTIDGGPYEEYF